MSDETKRSVLFLKLKELDGNFINNIKNYSLLKNDNLSSKLKINDWKCEFNIINFKDLMSDDLSINQKNIVYYKSDSNKSEVDTNNILKKQNIFNKNLVNFIINEDFEYGIQNKTDIFIIDSLKCNVYTKFWINDLFLKYFFDNSVIIGILRVISRIEYKDITPVGPTMALASLTHKNIEVRECAIRAFENWGDASSIEILETLSVSPVWLQDYVNEVVIDLRGKNHAYPY